MKASGRCLRFDAEELLQGVVVCREVKEVLEATRSEVVLENDEVSSQVKISHCGRTWLRYKLRDRRFDGPGWSPSSLTDWSYGRADDEFSLGPAVEESIYCLDPRYPLSDRFEERLAQFIANPFEALPFSDPTRTNLDGWLGKWLRIFSEESPPFPGYFALRKITGARVAIHRNAVVFLYKKGYAYLTAVPTWWHTAKICNYLGFEYQYEKDRNQIEKLDRALLATDISERRKLSWIVMLQFWAELVESVGLMPENFSGVERFILRDASRKLILFPLSPQRNLWQVYKL